MEGLPRPRSFFIASVSFTSSSCHRVVSVGSHIPEACSSTHHVVSCSFDLQSAVLFAALEVRHNFDFRPPFRLFLIGVPFVELAEFDL